VELQTFKALMQPEGQRALRAAMALEPREEDFLSHFSTLERRFARPVARTALEVAILRREATSKFPCAARMYFTRQALEQASSQEVSAYRARRYRGFRYLIDLGCSIGADTLVLAGQAPTFGLDRDVLRLAMAQANCRAVQTSHVCEFIRADLEAPLPLGRGSPAGLFFDPARRLGGRRIHSVENYLPPLSVVRAWLPHFPALGVKISPGVNLAELAGYDAEVEFISLNGDLKEAVLWFGALKSAEKRATLLPGPFTLVRSPELAAEFRIRGEQAQIIPLREPAKYIYEPDGAILRAGLVQDLGVELGAAQLDEDIAYLTSDRLVQTPFARVWAVEAWLPFGLKRLRAALRERNVGRVVVKKRGSPLQPEALIKDLRLEGDQERVIFLTHLRGRPIAILAWSELNSL
jgi:hypothetical protein